MTTDIKISRELAAQWLVDLEGCTAFAVAEQLRALLDAPTCDKCHGAGKVLISTVCGPVHKTCNQCKLAAPVVERQEPVAAQVRFRPTRKDLIGYRPNAEFGPWQYTDLARVDMSRLCYIDSVGYETEKRVLFASPPAPVAVQLDENVEFEKWWCRTPILRKGKLQIAQEAWEARACLDKAEEMNP